MPGPVITVTTLGTELAALAVTLEGIDVLLSRDFGASWAVLTRLERSSWAYSMVAATWRGQLTLLVTTPSGNFWVDITSGEVSPELGPGGLITKLMVDANGMLHAICVSAGTGREFTFDGVVWSQVNDTPADRLGRNHARVISFASGSSATAGLPAETLALDGDSSLGFAAANGALWKQVGGASEWTRVFTGDTVGVALSPGDRPGRTVLASTFRPGGIWQSQDGGLTWSLTLPLTREAWSVTFADSSHVLVSEGGELRWIES